MKYIINESVLTEIANILKPIIGLSPSDTIPTTDFATIIRDITGGKEYTSIAEAYEDLHVEDESIYGFMLDREHNVYSLDSSPEQFEDYSTYYYIFSSGYNEPFSIDYSAWYGGWFEYCRFIDGNGECLDTDPRSWVINPEEDSVSALRVFDEYTDFAVIVKQADYGWKELEIFDPNEEDSLSIYYYDRTYTLYRN